MTIASKAGLPRVLVFASLFPPQRNGGGPPVSISNLVNAIAENFQIFVISKNHEINSRQPLPNIHRGWNEAPFGHAYYTDSRRSPLRMLQLIRFVDPTVMYLNSLFSADDLFPALLYLWLQPKGAVRIIVNPRGEFLVNALRNSRLRKTAYVLLLRLIRFNRYVEWQVADPREAALLMRKVGGRAQYVLPNLSSLIVSAPPVSKRPGHLKVAYIARVHPHKNLLLVLEAMTRTTGIIELDIFGPIEDHSYWDDCLRLIRALPETVTVSYRGVLAREDIAAALSDHHVTILMSRSEAFGHSIVESLLAGRPVLISDQTPWTSVDSEGCGRALPVDQESMLTDAINAFTELGQDEYDEMSEAALAYCRSHFDRDRTVDAYTQLFGLSS